MRRFGLIGFPLGHSFSKSYYDEKIAREQLQDVGYDLHPLEDIRDLPALIAEQKDLEGINVTIPHKIAVMDYLDAISPEAKAIGAVNCIRIQRIPGMKPKLSGFNTDVYGFYASMQPLLKPHHQQALVLGNGGAAKAVCYALEKLGIAVQLVSRTPLPASGHLSYQDLDENVMAAHPLIVNTTPLGTFPDVNARPDIPYAFLGTEHLLYDLIYNPEKTAFLHEGASRGAQIKNGYEMLVKQAEHNWEIWHGSDAAWEHASENSIQRP